MNAATVPVRRPTVAALTVTAVLGLAWAGVDTYDGIPREWECTVTSTHQVGDGLVVLSPECPVLMFAEDGAYEQREIRPGVGYYFLAVQPWPWATPVVSRVCTVNPVGEWRG